MKRGRHRAFALPPIVPLCRGASRWNGTRIMHESTGTGPEQRITPGAAPLRAEESIFATPPRFPLDEEPSRPAPPAASARSRHVVTRVVLPSILFIAGIACIAWVTQYLPSRGRPAPEIKDAPKLEAIARFHGMIGIDDTTQQPIFGEASKEKPLVALWDKNKPFYAPEYEIAWGGYVDNGYYDFDVDNPNDVPIELSVLKTSCACSRIEASALSPPERASYQKLKESAVANGTFGRQTIGDFTWQVLREDKPNDVLTLPPGSAGLVRVYWDGNKKQQPETLTIHVSIGMRVKGSAAPDRSAITLVSRVQYVAPVRFHPDRLDAGVLGGKTEPARLSFRCWSATRDFAVAAAKTDPCVEIVPKPLTNEECRQLEADLAKDSSVSKVRAAYVVEVTVHEQRDGKQLDLGWLQRRLPLVFSSKDDALDVSPPLLQAVVEGEVRLVDAVDAVVRQNTLHLVGNAKYGTTCKVTLSARTGMELEFVKCEPARLDVGVKLAKKASAGATTTWEMELTMQPGNDPGPLPDDCVLVLRTRDAQGMSRAIRIRLVGSLLRG
jgi:hypothetical protein